jgi:hypothetical protein
MKQIMIKVLLLFTIVFLLSSCLKNDRNVRDTVLYYNLINHASGPIKVVFYRNYGYELNNFSGYDSVFYFNASEDRTLMAVYDDSYYYMNQTSENDSLSGIDVVKIFRNDTVKAQKNFLLRKYWGFKQVNRYKSEMTLEITDDSFKP